jgi:NAD(P)-dependent dehydrogenase (short-subunit alcohol dehydrogenase family)
MATFTKAFHRTPYPSILPTRPGLSQKGKTVLITGSAAGIGFAIARAFIAASPTRVIILSRRPEVLAVAKTKLESTKVAGSTTEILTTTCDIADTPSVEKMWAGLHDRGITVDVLVLNAVAPDLLPSLVAPGALETIKRVFDTNVFGNLSMTLKFFGQGVDYGKVCFSRASPRLRLLTQNSRF